MLAMQGNKSLHQVGAADPVEVGGSGSTLKGVLTGFAEALDRRLKGDKKEDTEVWEC